MAQMPASAVETPKIAAQAARRSVVSLSKICASIPSRSVSIFACDWRSDVFSASPNVDTLTRGSPMKPGHTP